MLEQSAALEKGRENWLNQAQIALITAFETERGAKAQIESESFQRESEDRQEMIREDWGLRLHQRIVNLKDIISIEKNTPRSILLDGGYVEWGNEPRSQRPHFILKDNQLAIVPVVIKKSWRGFPRETLKYQEARPLSVENWCYGDYFDNALIGLINCLSVNESRSLKAGVQLHFDSQEAKLPKIPNLT